MPETELRFGIKLDPVWEKCWSFGICFSHQFEETYLFINFFKWSVSIGRMNLEKKS